jgi:hypothetical protein
MPPSVPGMNATRAGLLNAISAGEFKLKKVEVDPEEQIKAKLNKLNANPGGLKAPSLMDIQGALARLKKVEIDPDLDSS